MRWGGMFIDNAARGHHSRHQGLEYPVRSPRVQHGSRVAYDEVAITGRVFADSPGDIGTLDRALAHQLFKTTRYR